jgi:hypothetical protein
MTDAPASADEGGRLSPLGRSAAAATALPLLATYFADAPTWDLQGQVQVGDAVADELSRFVRMRVAIASAGRLESILSRIARAPTFKYVQIRDESAGAIRGKLDVPRYLRTRLRTDSPTRYPIRVIHRGFDTPENVLAAHAAAAIASDLRQAPVRLLPRASPERLAIARHLASLSQILHRSNLAEATGAARSIRHRGQRHALLDRVRARVRAGHIARPEPYSDLLAWAQGIDGTQAGATVGEIEWSFYDARFDSKLFELWSLTLLLDSITSRLGPPIIGPRPLFERERGPLAVWRAAGGKFHLFFQASFERAGLGAPRWSFTSPSQKPLVGIPDISLSMELIGGQTIVALVDPKLRIRDGAPTEELYKLIGYFGNAGSGQAPLGAIVSYAPGNPRSYLLEDGSAGRLTAMAVDPEDHRSSGQQFTELVDRLLTSVGLDPSLMEMMPTLRAGSAEAEEAATAARQGSAVEAMRRQAALLPAGSIEPFRRGVAGLLAEAWDQVDEDTARMVATAEYFGMTAPDDADHSGPLLGLAAACERILYAGLFEAVRARRPRAFDDIKTLGSMIAGLRDALSSRPRSAAAKLVGREIDARGLDRMQLADVAEALRLVNVRYRIPAAHREIVDQALWQGGRLAILRPESGLLSRLLNVLAAGGPRP